MIDTHTPELNKDMMITHSAKSMLPQSAENMLPHCKPTPTLHSNKERNMCMQFL
jgi:hypothetical protein